MKIVLNPKYKELEGFVKSLPVSFDKGGEIIYDGRNIVKVIEFEGQLLNVKAFGVPNLVNQFIYGHFRKSKARRSYEYAQLLLSKGINTPMPIAYLELTEGFTFGRSFYVTVQENFDGLMREFKWGKLEGRENLLKQFGIFTADLHTKEVLHLDYSPGNILYKKQGEFYSFYLVDLNRMKFGTVSLEEGCRNFRRLWGNEKMLSYIATEYAIARNFDVQQCIELTLQYHREFWNMFTKKHPEKKSYEE